MRIANSRSSIFNFNCTPSFKNVMGDFGLAEKGLNRIFNSVSGQVDECRQVHTLFTYIAPPPSTPHKKICIYILHIREGKSRAPIGCYVFYFF